MVHYLNMFWAISGVKQGDVLSPVIFTVYTDGLLVKLSNANVGCYVGEVFVGVLAYADDIVLLAPTVPQQGVGCFKFVMSMLRTYSIIFNVKKSKCLVAAPKSHRSLLLNGSICPFFVGGFPIDFD